MQPNRLLTIASLVTVLLFTFHWTDDIIRGMAPGGLSALYGVAILIVWLYGTLVLGERRSGHIIMLLGSLVAVVALVLHLRGAGLVGGRIANSGGKFFWVWTLLALGASGALCAIFSVRGLWSLRSRAR